jgi:hypothetical protein
MPKWPFKKSPRAPVTEEALSRIEVARQSGARKLSVLKNRAKERSPKPPREILDYYFATCGAKGRTLREVKLIVVGRGGAGKTPKNLGILL